jgi:hypothetical protein
MWERAKRLWLWSVCGPLVAQQMPYPVAYTYVAMAESGDGWSVTATSVANTNCTSGHTLPAVAVTVFNPGRTRSAFASNDYSPYCYGQATAYLPLCSGGQCEDGRFEADNEGTTEYCPIAFAFLAAVAAQGSEQVEAYKYIVSARWDPPGPLERRNGASTFYVRGGMSAGCQASQILLARALSQRPRDRQTPIQFQALPTVGLQGCSPPPGQPTRHCEVSWDVETSSQNQGSGYIDGTGRVDGPSTCPTRGSPIARSSIQVQ